MCFWRKFFAVFFVVFMGINSGFADGVMDGAIGGYSKASSEMWISRWFFENLANEDKTITPDMLSAMLAKYDELAMSEDVVMKSSIGNEYFTVLDGNSPLTYADLNAICLAGGFNTKDLCYDHVINPIYAQIGRIHYGNVCKGEIHGGNQHCVDDVFVKEYEITEVTKGEVHNARQEVAEGKEPRINFHSDGLVMDGDNYRYDTKTDVTHESGKSYAQDVSVSEWTAFGLAIEYAHNHGHRVLCNSKIEHDWINCTSLDNKDFYSFKFADTHSRGDSGVVDGQCSGMYQNIARGICAMFESPAYDACTVVCEKQCTPEMESVSRKFAMRAKKGDYMYGFANVKKGCAITGEFDSEIGNKLNLKTYPGYEYMSYGFQNIQTVLGPSLINIIKLYVRANGVDVEAFSCNYAPKKYENDYVLGCKINGKDVEFLFNDLYEDKSGARTIGDSGMKCLLQRRENGGTATFDGKFCRGPTQAQCAELGTKIPGGTSWDDGAGACVLNDAKAAKDLQETLTIVGGATFAVVMTVLSGGGVVLVLVEAGASVGLDLAFEGVNRFYETRPHHLATEFVQAAQSCGLLGDDKQMCSNKTCIQGVVSKYMASMDSVVGDGVDALNDDELKLVDGVYGRIGDCLSDAEIKAAVKSTEILTADKFMSRASMAMMIGGFFISPSNAVKKLSFLPKTAKILRRAGLEPIERFSSTLGGTRYHRIYVDNLTDSDINRVVDELQQKGFYVSANSDGKRFLGFSDLDIFGPWSNEPNNWLFAYKYKSMQDVRGINFETLRQQRGIYNQRAGDFVVEGFVDNTGFFGRLNSVYNKEIARIGKTPVKIVDSGSISGRGIVIVNVGNRNIPFYVSTGSGGKLNVPTGKWEAFWGISEDARGWFNKGGQWLTPEQQLDRIANHYYSAELRYIANSLDEVLGDPRNRLYLMLSEKRVTSGGIGLVGDVDNMNSIDKSTINSCFNYRPMPNLSNNMEMNIKEITDYLRSLR